MSNTYILYHGNCFDGFGAAYVAWLKFGDSATYLECHYGKQLPYVPDNAQVYMIDFSSNRETIETLAKRVNLTILDHHISAQQNLKELPYATFDMNRSGAMMAWDHFFFGEAPAIISYIQDRDLWLNKLPNTEKVHASLASYPKTFESWKSWENKKWNEVIKEGESILRYANQQVEMICSKAELIDINNFKVAVVNSTSHWSDVGSYLLKKFSNCDYSASYYIDGNQKKWSLRSRPGFDVSIIAKTLGGGGHAQAAGYVEQL